MSQEPESNEMRPKPPPLKVPEPEVNPQDPWGDDRLERKEVADRLTSIVRDQEQPFVISVDGRWGTGKTFLLKRWVQDLRKQEPSWQAIYYNAWEDDFADDPLVAIVGQLSEHFDKSSFSGAVRELVHLALPLLDLAAPFVPFGQFWPWLRALCKKGKDQPTPESVRRYNERRATTDDLKRGLTKLAVEVRERTGHPLVFVVDELDRCRPKFAIELLERVKHIFDVPNVVFVFGINRSELVNALKSIYGEIDADVYVRRFFDMPFVLPEPDGPLFCRHLALQFGLSEYFQQLSVSGNGPVWFRDVRAIDEQLPTVLGNMGLSLRDLDYCARLISLAMRDFSGGHPLLFLLLVALKIKQPDLYQRFVERRARGAEVVDYLFDETPLGTRSGLHLSLDPSLMRDRVAAAVYCADDAGIVEEQLQSLALKKKPGRPEYLSQEHARRAGEDSQYAVRFQGLLAKCTNDPYRPDVGLWSMAKTIDLYYRMTRLPGT